MEYPSMEVIVVDNASEDGSAEAIEKKFPLAKVVRSSENLGLAGGRNLGQAYARGDYILYLDSDTILDKRMISELVSVLEVHPDAGIAVPKMYYYNEPDYIWYAGSEISLLSSRTINRGVNEKDIGQYEEVCETAHGPTAFMATRAAVEKVKGHDEIYCMSYADADFAVRIKEAGPKILYAPKAILWHRLSMMENVDTIRGLGYTLPMRAFYFARNRAIFMKRNATRPAFVVFMLVFFPAFTLFMTYKIIRLGGVREFLYQHLAGSWQGLLFALFPDNHAVPLISTPEVKK
jgi:GT2 family glycosyltransferase